MSSSAEKRRISAERKASSIINNSTSKALFSFPRSERFPQRNYRSLTDVRFYDVNSKMYDKKVTFSSSNRIDFAKKDGVPGPTRYNVTTGFLDKKVGIQFKSGRDVHLFQYSGM